jgi:hypothetical protein
MAGMSVEPGLVDEVTEAIRRRAREAGVRLTNGAEQMLIIPIIETYEFTRSYDRNQVESSLQVILNAAHEVRDILTSRDGPEVRDDRPLDDGRESRSSIAIIEAFARTFCGIPPFCGRR